MSHYNYTSVVNSPTRKYISALENLIFYKKRYRESKDQKDLIQIIKYRKEMLYHRAKAREYSKRMSEVRKGKRWGGRPKV